MSYQGVVSNPNYDSKGRLIKKKKKKQSVKPSSVVVSNPNYNRDGTKKQSGGRSPFERSTDHLVSNNFSPSAASVSSNSPLKDSSAAEGDSPIKKFVKEETGIGSLQEHFSTNEEGKKTVDFEGVVNELKSGFTGNTQTDEGMIMASGISVPGIFPKNSGGFQKIINSFKSGNYKISALDDALKIGGSTKPPLSSADNIVTNTKTARLTKALINKILSNKKTVTTLNPNTGTTTTKIVTSTGKLITATSLAAFTIGALGTYPWNKHLEADNLLFHLNSNIRTAEETGNQELIDEAYGMAEEFFNPNFQNQIWSLVPFANVVNTGKKTVEAAKLGFEISNYDKANTIEGESETDKWSRLHEEQASLDKEVIDYYNEKRKLMVEWEREAAKNARDEDAAFWAEQREQQRAAEAADRKAIADFWTAYRKQAAKYAAENRPSKLNFGLL